VDLLIGNPEKAKQNLNWTPQTDIYQLLKEMVEYDCK